LRDLFGEFAADAFGRGDLVDGGAAEAGDTAEFLEKQLFAVLRNSGAFVEEALGDAPFHEELMIAVGKPVRFVANALEELEGSAVVGELEWLGTAGAIDFLEFLGQTDDRDVVEAELLEFAAGGAELALAAVDDDEVGKGGWEIGARRSAIGIFGDAPGEIEVG
jgi:hypothetical protein